MPINEIYNLEHKYKGFNYIYEDLLGQDGLIYEVKTLVSKGISDTMQSIKNNLIKNQFNSWSVFHKIVLFERHDIMYRILDVLNREKITEDKNE